MRATTLMLKMFWSPGAAFEEIRDRGVGPWIPMLILVGFGAAGSWLLLSRIDLGEALMREVMRSPQAGNMSLEDAERLRGALDSPVVSGGILAVGIGFFPVWIVLVSAFFFGVFLVLGSRAGFMQFWSVTAFAFAPSLLASVAGTAVTFTIPPAALQLSQMNVLSPAVFITLESGDTAGGLYVLAQSLSLTTIWTLVLLVIGYGVIGPKRTSVTFRMLVVFIPWVVLVALRVLPTMILS